MNKKPVVLIDMDGVLADFDGATARFLRDNHPSIEIAERRNFYFRGDYPDPGHQAIINQLHASKGFFRSLPLIPGAREGWQKIIDLGYEPRICSSPLHSNEWCREEKLAWISEHLGKAALETAIITGDKDTCEGIALIDDRPEIRNAERASWKHVVFGQPYNQHVDTEYRLRDWYDESLADTLARCRELAA